jgi:hypothetical protein
MRKREYVQACATVLCHDLAIGANAVTNSGLPNHSGA